MYPASNNKKYYTLENEYINFSIKLTFITSNIMFDVSNLERRRDCMKY